MPGYTMNIYLEKVAEGLSNKTKRDMVDTATLGTVGGLETIGMSKLLSHPRLASLGAGKKLALGAGVTLGVDYAGLKLARKINTAMGHYQPQPVNKVTQ